MSGRRHHHRIPLANHLPPPASNSLNSGDRYVTTVINRCRRWMSDEALMVWRNCDYDLAPCNFVDLLDFNRIYESMPADTRVSPEKLRSRQSRLAVFVYVRRPSYKNDVTAVFSDGSRMTLTLRQFTENLTDDRFDYYANETLPVFGDEVRVQKSYLCPRSFLRRLCHFLHYHVDPAYPVCVTPPLALPLHEYMWDLDAVESRRPFTPQCAGYDHFASLPVCTHPPFMVRDGDTAVDSRHELDTFTRVVLSQGALTDGAPVYGDLYVLLKQRAPFRESELRRCMCHSSGSLVAVSEPVRADERRCGVLYYRADTRTVHRTNWSLENIADLYMQWHESFDPLGSTSGRASAFPVSLCGGRFLVHSDEYVYAATPWGQACLGHFVRLGALLRMLVLLRPESAHENVVQFVCSDPTSTDFHVYKTEDASERRFGRLAHEGHDDYARLFERLEAFKTYAPSDPQQPLFASYVPSREDLAMVVHREETDTDNTDDEEYERELQSVQKMSRAYFRAHFDYRAKTRFLRGSRGSRAFRRWYERWYREGRARRTHVAHPHLAFV